MKSAIYTSGERDPRQPLPPQQSQGKLYLMGHDPRLPRMPEKPTLFDFFKLASDPPRTCSRARASPRRTA